MTLVLAAGKARQVLAVPAAPVSLGREVLHVPGAPEIHSADVVILGSGGAGLRAAIACSASAHVVLLSKGPFGRAGASILAGADIMADGQSLCRLGLRGDPQYTQESWFNDLLVEGFYLNNQALVEQYVVHAPARLKELLDWGLRIDPDFSGKREVMTTGAEIMRILRGVARSCGVRLCDFVMAVDLLVSGDAVCGVLALDLKTGQLMVFRSKAVLIATGGWHGLYSFNTGSSELTGDGVAMAYRAGAEVSSMEMTTFCPNVICYPPAYRGSVFCYTLPGELVNDCGEAFLRHLDPGVLELIEATDWDKLVVSRAIHEEVENGRGSPHGGVHFTLAKETKGTPRAGTGKRGWWFQGIDYSGLAQQLDAAGGVEVGCAAHYFNGGIRTNKDGETTLTGLFAAGECTGELFGANRVSAATTEMLVQGEKAGTSAARYARALRAPIPPSSPHLRDLAGSVQGFQGRKRGTRPCEIRERIEGSATDRLGVVRSRDGLEQALRVAALCQDAVAELRIPMRPFCARELVEVLEVRNLAQLLQIVSLSALAREESRGVHFRRDFGEIDNDHWLKAVVVRRRNGSAVMTTEPVVAASRELPRGRVSQASYLLSAARTFGGGAGRT